MKKILILGANGMLGHVLFNSFIKNNQFITIGTYNKNTFRIDNDFNIKKPKINAIFS